DRGHRSMNHLFTENHLGVKRALAHLIQTAKNLGIPSSICNSALANDPDLVAELVRWGITTISVEGFAIHQTYQAIVKAEAKLPVGDGRVYPGLGQ
ncbi:MAG: putative PEP-binding protein, partial [Synechococcales cyanobacterium]